MTQSAFDFERVQQREYEHFDGPAFEPEKDEKALTLQHDAIKKLMLDGKWRTLAEISKRLGYPESSVSAQLRHLRKKRFGSYQVSRRRRAEFRIWEYKVEEPESV